MREHCSCGMKYPQCPLDELLLELAALEMPQNVRRNWLELISTEVRRWI